LITPRVVGTPVDAQRITDEMRRATPELNDAVRKAPRPPTTTPPLPVVPGAVLIPVPPPPGSAPVPPFVPERTPSPPGTPLAPGEPPSGVPPIPPAPPPR
jgi:hypothetical protein